MNLEGLLGLLMLGSALCYAWTISRRQHVEIRISGGRTSSNVGDLRKGELHAGGTHHTEFCKSGRTLRHGASGAIQIWVE
jgi:hypothetical protein